MKERTALQRITDALEAAGVAVSAIETWPPDEEGRVSVSLMVRPPVREMSPSGETVGRDEYPTWQDVEDRAEAVIAALNTARDPSRPPAVRNPCADCGDLDCDTCPVKDSTPIKLYTPKEAAAEMRAGRILKGSGGETYYYSDKSQGKLPPGFYHNDKDGVLIGPARDFSGLYEEAQYV
ncbi:MAG: hypothetical protein LBP74_05730 [Treponema sp.]|jgi:hypothetical protein|nr:hypothetical protein [Treponema sp.]